MFSFCPTIETISYTSAMLEYTRNLNFFFYPIA